MVKINLVCVGTLKEKFFSDAIAEYTKRLGKFCKLSIVEIKESSPKQECEQIMQKASGKVFVCHTGGAMVSSTDIADKIKSTMQTSSTITFVVGGSDGFSTYLDNFDCEKICFGKITLPHQLFRVVLAEQIYRAFTIIEGHKYHK